MSAFLPSDRQRDIYIRGSRGIKPELPVDFRTLEEKAKKKLSRDAFGYIACGAGQEDGIRNNLKAFSSYSLIPSMASGLSSVDTGIELLGKSLPFPVLFAPIGVLSLAHPRGDLELASASDETRVPMIFSNQASYPMEETAKEIHSGPYWFQLYFSKSKDLVDSLVHRAESCGCSALVLTLDTTTLGWRVQDLNAGYLPFIRGLGIAQYTSDPVFRDLMADIDLSNQDSGGFSIKKLMLAHDLMKNYPGAYWNNWRTKDPIRAVRKFIEIYSRPELSWEDVCWLKSRTRLPLILKGILRPDDALRGLDAGADAIVVSNHGGRQVDRVISSLDALPVIRKQLPTDFPLLLDSGIRTGSDIFTALALGANAVLVGRPYVYAMALKGKAGVVEWMGNLLAELEITMKLTGCCKISEIHPGLVIRK